MPCFFRLVRADSETAELEGRELSFRIDKRTHSSPRVLPESGTYWDPISMRFEMTPGDTVFYSIQGDVVRAPRQWDGSDISV
jgi:hypothetical protein